MKLSYFSLLDSTEKKKLKHLTQQAKWLWDIVVLLVQDSVCGSGHLNGFLDSRLKYEKSHFLSLSLFLLNEQNPSSALSAFCECEVGNNTLVRGTY